LYRGPDMADKPQPDRSPWPDPDQNFQVSAARHIVGSTHALIGPDARRRRGRAYKPGDGFAMADRRREARPATTAEENVSADHPKAQRVAATCCERAAEARREIGLRYSSCFRERESEIHALPRTF
jgi:hypothetical protein